MINRKDIEQAIQQHRDKEKIHNQRIADEHIKKMSEWLTTKPFTVYKANIKKDTKDIIVSAFAKRGIPLIVNEREDRKVSGKEFIFRLNVKELEAVECEAYQKIKA